MNGLKAHMEMKKDAGVERVPGWEAHAWLRAGFSRRGGGRSHAYGAAELNLGWTPEDSPENVWANRQAFAAALAPEGNLTLVTVSQVHGASVRVLEVEAKPWMTAGGRARFEGDGLVTATKNHLLAVLTADCVPILLADVRTHAVGALHAGWRGTLAGIAAEGVARMQHSFGSRPEEILAAIGPCIRSCCFAIGPEVQAAFLEKTAEASSLFSMPRAVEADRKAALHMDLVEANRRQLLQAGLRGESLTVVGGCTACARTATGERQYFSYRAEQGRTGRMLSAVAAMW